MKLKEALRYKGYSFDKFATMVGVAPTTVSKWVHGKFIPKKDTLKIISKVLCLSYDETINLFEKEN